eukprot:2816811-Pyramimonas_sp.AAC.1
MAPIYRSTGQRSRSPTPFRRAWGPFAQEGCIVFLHSATCSINCAGEFTGADATEHSRRTFTAERPDHAWPIY